MNGFEEERGVQTTYTNTSRKQRKVKEYLDNLALDTYESSPSPLMENKKASIISEQAQACYEPVTSGMFHYAKSTASDF